MKITLALVALAGISLPAALAPCPVHATPSFAATESHTYEIDPTHSGVLFRIVHMGVAPFWGRFNHVAGEFLLDREDPTKCKVDVEIQAASVDTASADRDRHVSSPDFLNVKEFPTITFASKSVAKGKEKDTFLVTGDLTFHGVTKEVVIDARLIGEGDTGRGMKCGFEGEFTIDRNDYGVKSLPGGLGDEVKLVLFVEAGRQ